MISEVLTGPGGVERAVMDELVFGYPTTRATRSMLLSRCKVKLERLEIPWILGERDGNIVRLPAQPSLELQRRYARYWASLNELEDMPDVVSLGEARWNPALDVDIIVGLDGQFYRPTVDELNVFVDLAEGREISNVDAEQSLRAALDKREISLDTTERSRGVIDLPGARVDSINRRLVPDMGGTLIPLTPRATILAGVFFQRPRRYAFAIDEIDRALGLEATSKPRQFRPIYVEELSRALALGADPRVEITTAKKIGYHLSYLPNFGDRGLVGNGKARTLRPRRTDPTDAGLFEQLDPRQYELYYLVIVQGKELPRESVLEILAGGSQGGRVQAANELLLDLHDKLRKLEAPEAPFLGLNNAFSVSTIRIAPGKMRLRSFAEVRAELDRQADEKRSRQSSQPVRPRGPASSAPRRGDAARVESQRGREGRFTHQVVTRGNGDGSETSARKPLTQAQRRARTRGELSPSAEPASRPGGQNDASITPTPSLASPESRAARAPNTARAQPPTQDPSHSVVGQPVSNEPRPRVNEPVVGRQLVSAPRVAGPAVPAPPRHHQGALYIAETARETQQSGLSTAAAQMQEPGDPPVLRAPGRLVDDPGAETPSVADVAPVRPASVDRSATETATIPDRKAPQKDGSVVTPPISR